MLEEMKLLEMCSALSSVRSKVAREGPGLENMEEYMLNAEAISEELAMIELGDDLPFGC